MTDEELAAKFKFLEDKINKLETQILSSEEDIDSLENSLANALSGIKSLRFALPILTDE